MSQFVEIWTLRLFHEKEHVFTCIHLICKANLSNSNSILYPHSDLHVNISILCVLPSLFLLGILFAHSFL